MSTNKVYLAVDLGAESGRVVAGEFDGDRLALKEIHRFPNGAVEVEGTLRWDIDRLWGEIKKGIGAARQEYGDNLTSLGVDSWGVDYGYCDANGDIIDQPYNYRDSRSNGMNEEAFKRVPKREIYDTTGIQFMGINSIYQILSDVINESPYLKQADSLLFIPDLINCWLTGRKTNERTIASTSQLLEAYTGQWATELMAKLGIPPEVFSEVVPPGSPLDVLKKSVAEETGALGLQVVVPGCHDTASAVAAVPSSVENYVYLSSGTWSLMGIESIEPVINDLSYESDFTNEAGVNGTFRVLKNISGLWILQETKRTWADRGQDYTYDRLTHMAGEAEPFQSMINPGDETFLSTGDMPQMIRDYCDKMKLAQPASEGSTVRTILESLALTYRFVYGKLEQLAGQSLDVLHIVGGGTQNKLLNQFSANATGRQVIAGPAEATSAGNIIVQMMAMEDIESLRDGRALVKASFETDTYEPQDTDQWEEAYQDFLRLQTGEC